MGDPFLKSIHISIHAPPRGATSMFDLEAFRFPYFNSRPSARGDVINSFL